MVLPAGFALPPLPYLVGLLVADAAVLAWLLRARPAVTERVILALAPWMVAGSGLHAVYTVEGAPPAVEPLLGTPAVYMTVLAIAGGTWWATVWAEAPVDRTLGGVGVGAAVAAVVTYLGVVPTRTLGGLGWIAGVLFLTGVVTGVVWLGVARRIDTRGVAAVGPLIVASHALDGVSTAVGVAVFGFGERTPAARVLLDIGRSVPIADVLGGGWLFVLVKLGVAAAVVWLFADFVREDPTQGYLLTGVIAAVGLGPGAFNLLLMLA